MGVFYVSALDANTAWIAGGNSWNRVFQTTNGGLSWNELDYPRKNFINKIHFFNANTGLLFVDHPIPPFADSSNYLVTRDGGANWYRPANAPIIASFTNNQINIVDTSFIVFLAPPGNNTHKKLFRLIGGLDSRWESVDLPAVYPRFSVFKDHINGLATGLIEPIYRSSNSGTNWYSISDGGFSLHDGMNVAGTD